MAGGANRRATDRPSVPQLTGGQRVRSWLRTHAPANDNEATGFRRLAPWGKWLMAAGICLILAALFLHPNYF